MKKSHCCRHYIRQNYEILSSSDDAPPTRLVTRKAKLWHSARFCRVYYGTSHQMNKYQFNSGRPIKSIGMVYFLRFIKNNPLYSHYE